MKKIILLLLGLSTLYLSPLAACTLERLQGSYTRLPKILKPLSLLDGAAALEIQMISSMYENAPAKELNKNFSRIIQGLFHLIPNTEHLELSKILDKKTLIENLINNLVYRFLRRELAQISPIQLTDFATHFKDIYQIVPQPSPIQKISAQLHENTEQIGTSIKVILDERIFEKPKKEPIRTLIPASCFANASFAPTRLTILGAIWYYKKHIKDFDYERLLQKALLNACNKLLQKNKLPAAISNKITQIKEAALAIAPELPLQPLPAIKQIDKALNRYLNNLSPELIKHLTILNLPEDEYETYLIHFISAFESVQSAPPILAQVANATISLKNKTYSFADCVETLIRNLINILAYNTQTQMTDLQKLKNAFPNARQELIAFYENYQYFDLQTPAKDATEQQKTAISQYNSHSHKTPQAYNDWAKLVSNVPNIKYGETDHNMEPTWANLISILDYLLGLGWCKNENPLLQPVEFAKKHLQKLITLFGSSNFDPNTIKNEYGDLTIQRNDYNVIIQLNPGHGFASYKQNPILFFLSPETYTTYPSLNVLYGLSDYLQDSSDTLPLYNLLGTSRNDANLFLTCLFQSCPTIPIKRHALIEKYIEKIDDPALQENYKIALYLRSLPVLDKKRTSKPKLENIEKTLNKRLEKALVEKSNISNFNFLSQCISANFKREAIASSSLITISSQREIANDAPIAAFYLLKELNNQGHNFNLKELALAAERIPYSTQNSRERLSFFKFLVEKDIAFDRAANEAKQVLEENFGLFTGIDALYLFEELFKKNKGFDTAQCTIKKILQIPQNPLRRKLEIKNAQHFSTLRLLKALVSSGQATDLANQIIEMEIITYGDDANKDLVKNYITEIKEIIEKTKVKPNQDTNKNTKKSWFYRIKEYIQQVKPYYITS